MAWNLTYHETQPDKVKVGDLWPVEKDAKYLSDEYRRDWSKVRLPLMVCLPGGTWFCLDGRPRLDDPSGWKVQQIGELVPGEKPDLTVSPSIAISYQDEGRTVSVYHGWIRSGLLTDDVDGNQYEDEDRKLILRGRRGGS